MALFRLKKWIWIALALFILCITLVAEQFRGQFTYAKCTASSITSTMRMGDCPSQIMLSNVGGVCFETVAQFEGNAIIKELLLEYDPSATDGNRLSVRIDGINAKANLPDWLLIPIVRYADTPFYTCVTFFGDLDNKKIAKKIRKQKNTYIINYHPALQNTLLGLRLMDLDMLVSYPHTSDLPKTDHGKYILGNGEKPPNVYTNNEARSQFQAFRLSLTSDPNYYRSYVISDFGRTITFSVRQNQLILSGIPYLYFWKYKNDCRKYNAQAARDSITRYHQSAMDSLNVTGNTYSSRIYLIHQLSDAASLYDENFSFLQGTFVDLCEKRTAKERELFLNNYATESLWKMLISVDSGMDANTPLYLKVYSDSISERRDLLREMNPAVWDEAVVTMQYAAFFRYCNIFFPDQWNRLVAKLKVISAKPKVKTPTVMYPTENQKVATAISSILTK